MNLYFNKNQIILIHVYIKLHNSSTTHVCHNLVFIITDTGKYLPPFLFLLPFAFVLNGRIQDGAKLFESVEMRKLHGSKITVYTEPNIIKSTLYV